MVRFSGANGVKTEIFIFEVWMIRPPVLVPICQIGSHIETFCSHIQNPWCPFFQKVSSSIFEGLKWFEMLIEWL